MEEINELKNGKAASRLGIKSEMWKRLMMEIGAEKIRNIFEKVMEGNVPDSRMDAKVNLIPKNDNHKVKIDEFRPPVITEISYKIMSRLLKKKLVRFVENNKILREEQCGFTKRKRLEENLIVIQV